MKILDQTGRELHFEEPPRRIVSLVPSITELAFDLGFDVVGKTKFCIHPENLASAIIVGGTKNVKVDLIEKVRPDLVLANKEENTKSTVEQLIKSDLPVFVSDVPTIARSLDLIVRLGKIGGFEKSAENLTETIIDGFESIPPIKPQQKVLYLIWKEPFMAAGSDTYISDLMNLLGMKNVLADWGERGQRYPEVKPKEIEELNPDLILLSSEPYPFKEVHRKSIDEMFGASTLLVDGEFFSWYGSRQVKSVDYLRGISRLLSNRIQN